MGLRGAGSRGFHPLAMRHRGLGVHTLGHRHHWGVGVSGSAHRHYWGLEVSDVLLGTTGGWVGTRGATGTTGVDVSDALSGTTGGWSGLMRSRVFPRGG
ncbi:hypothetical protein ADL05_04665 [Nocardiopsis sp. NRRL B-16309]|nr:hypothetical protein ADL05_04665 [Nocardiopsis sp. NRRL B-16309]